MAYIVGIVTEEEEAILRRRGWDIEPAPKELVRGSGVQKPERFIMVWVDNDMFSIMSGPDWATAEVLPDSKK